MVSIARKNLFQEKTRLLISSGGVAFAVTLMLILIGLYQGWNHTITAFLDNIEADYWIIQKGAGEMSHSVSLIPADIGSRVERIEHVEVVYPFVGRQISFDLHGRDANLFLVGFDTENDVAGPIEIVKGSRVPQQGEIIVDKVFAKNEHLDIGDTIEIKEKEFDIVGISSGGNMIVYQYAFVQKKDAEDVFEVEAANAPILHQLGVHLQAEYANYLIVQAVPGEEEDALYTLNEGLSDDYEVKSKSVFIQENKKMIQESFLPIILVLNIIAILIGVSVIGLTIYTSTVEKSTEFGVLKAIGASNRKLYLIVLEQCVISSGIGFFVGVVATFGILALVGNYVPAFSAQLGMKEFAWVFGAALAMSFIAAYIPLSKIIKIDPAKVFRA